MLCRRRERCCPSLRRLGERGNATVPPSAEHCKEGRQRSLLRQNVAAGRRGVASCGGPLSGEASRRRRTMSRLPGKMTRRGLRRLVVEVFQLFDLPQHRFAPFLELGGEATARAQEEIGARLGPEDGSLVVEEQRAVRGEGRQERYGGAEPAASQIP